MFDKAIGEILKQITFYTRTSWESGFVTTAPTVVCPSKS